MQALSMNVAALVAIGLGATLGAWLRWGLALCFNSVWLTVPLGTLIANLGGGFVIGLLAVVLGQHPELSPQWRLFLMTGFLGGLTTFSTFSLESMTLLQKGHYAAMLLHSGLHLVGSVALCGVGFFCAKRLFA